MSEQPNALEFVQKLLLREDGGSFSALWPGWVEEARAIVEGRAPSPCAPKSLDEKRYDECLELVYLLAACMPSREGMRKMIQRARDIIGLPLNRKETP
jgi:hypothetical protein